MAEEYSTGQTTYPVSAPASHGAPFPRSGVPVRLWQEIQEVLRRGDGELTPTSSPNHQPISALLVQSPARGNSWLTWLVLSSSCEKNEIRRQEWSNA